MWRQTVGLLTQSKALLPTPPLKNIWMASVSLVAVKVLIHLQKTVLLTLQLLVNDTGQSKLFALVRKPAYAAEQAIWISYYFFSVAASYSYPEHYWNWSGSGFVLLCILFQVSGWLTEKISITKYPKYRLYQQKVPLYVPRISSLWHVIVGYNKKE